ncbi:MAG: winged helix-turn-helix domain-containing protein [Halobacteria archaeon]|nr:winged helix-turn-helix domain-containing protein [Halobacteria archaeon]
MKDINEEVEEDWVEETDGGERVGTVIRNTTEPKTVKKIAEECHVTQKTARKHLDRLVDYGVAEKIHTGEGVKYRRDPNWYVLQEISFVIENNTKAEIEEGIHELRNEIEEYRHEYDSDSPEDLLNELDVADSEEEAEEVWQDYYDWRSTEKSLKVSKMALQFSGYHDNLGSEEKARA